MKFKTKDYLLAILVALSILLGIFLRYEMNKNTDLAREKAKVENNLRASEDSILTYINMYGQVVSEKGAYEYTLKELKDSNKDLYKKWLDLKNKPPKTVTEIEYVIVESYKDYPNVIKNNDTTGSIVLTIDTVYDEFNNRTISVNVPWSIEYYSEGKRITLSQSNSIAKLKTGLSSIDLKQTISIKSAVIYDENEGRWKTVFTSDYPGLTLNQLGSVYVSDEYLPNDVKMSMRRQYGIGVHLGAGIGYNPFVGPIFPSFHLGVGLNYTPKKLQFK